MSGFADGKYLIVLATPSAPPPFPTGANHGGGPTSPVVVGGEDNVWTVANTSEDGNYTLVLEQAGTRWLSQAAGETVIVGIMPLPGIWTIQRQPGGSYTIEVPSPIFPTRAWTASDSKPGSPVNLNILELPLPNQLWRFIPVNE